MSKSTAGPSKASKTQADIREVMTKIHSKAHHQRRNKPGPVSKPTPPVAVPQASTAPIVQNATAQLQDNAFAMEIFIKHTNIADIVAEKIPERCEKTRQKYRLELYQTYVKSSILRISDPLHKLRFETRFWEGLFRMATTMPLREERDYRGLEHTLAQAGMKKLCFVDMTQDNILLEYQKNIISLLQSRFKNWPLKLRKLPTYLQDQHQRKEVKLEHNMKKLKHQIKAHGNVDWQNIVHMEDRMLCELLGPVDKRTLNLWHTFAFDDDNMNKKYHLGKYYRDRVDRMPVKTMFEKIPGPNICTHASLSSAPAPSVSRASPFASPRRPISRDALAKPNELTFVPYDSSTQNQDAMRSWRRSHTQAQPVILQPSTSTNPNVTVDLSVAPDSIVSVMEIDHDSENIDTTNERADQLVAKQSNKGSAEKAGSGNTGDQEPPVKRRDLQITEEEAMDAAADDTTSSLVVATQSTMRPPATRKCPTPPQISEEEAMDVGANDSAASLVTCAQPGYSLDYVKCCTNIYPVMIKLRLEKHPKAPLTPLIMEKLVKKTYHLHQESFARSELPAGFRKLNATEQMALKTKGPFAWAWEQLHTPIGTERSKSPVVPKSKTPVANATTPDVQETTAADVNANERSRACEQLQTPIGTECSESPLIETSKTPVEKVTAPDVQEITSANAKANERLRESQQQTAERVVMQAKRQKKHFAFPRVRSTRPQNIVYESDTPPVTEPVFVGIDNQAAASQNQHTATNVDPLYEPDTTSFRPFVSSTHSQDGSIQPGQPDAQEKNVPPVSEPHPNQQNTATVDTLFQPDLLTFGTFVSSTQSQDGSSQPGQPDAPEENVPPVSEPYQNQQNTPTVDTLSEPDSMTFRPFVSSTQHPDGNSQQKEPDAPEENVPPVLEPNQNQQNTPTVDTLSEPDTLTFRPFVSSTQLQDTNSQQEQPVPMEGKPPQALATTSRTPPVIPADDSASCVVIKEERISQQQDTSGYAGYVEEIPSSTQIYTIIDSDDDVQEEFEAHRRPDAVQNSLCGSFQQHTDPIEAQLNSMFSSTEATDMHDGQIQSFGRFNRLSLEQQMVFFAEGWKLIVDSHRKRQRPPVKDLCFTLAKVPLKSTVHPALPFDFLIDIDIESVRYTQRPIRWRGCNELQQNQLTVNLHHRTAGIFTVSVRDQQVGHLLGLLGPGQTSSAGWEALTASLAHVGKFRYGRKEPSTEYYRMSVVEKVLHLYFDTLPSFPRDGGFVLRLDQDRSTFPADGGTVNLERFNVNLHSKQRSKSDRKGSNTTKQTADDEEGLENFLMPGVAEAMTKMHRCIFPNEQS